MNILENCLAITTSACFMFGGLGLVFIGLLRKCCSTLSFDSFTANMIVCLFNNEIYDEFHRLTFSLQPGKFRLIFFREF